MQVHELTSDHMGARVTLQDSEGIEVEGTLIGFGHGGTYGSSTAFDASLDFYGGRSVTVPTHSQITLIE